MIMDNHQMVLTSASLTVTENLSVLMASKMALVPLYAPLTIKTMRPKVMIYNNS